MGKLLVLLACVCVASAHYIFKPEYERTALGDSIDLASMKVLETVYDDAPEKNIVSSPLGLMILLSLFNEGAAPATKDEITNFLGGIDAKQAEDAFKDLAVKYSEMDHDYLNVAEKVSVSNRYTLRNKFAEHARGFRSEFDTLDFSNPEEAAAEINKWAAEKTEGRISDPVSPPMLSPNIAAAFFNIIYFKGHWHVPFKAPETEEKDFHLNLNDVVKKPMMHLYKSLYYAESVSLGARLIELPYQEDGFRMVIVLPNEIDGLPSVLKKASLSGLLSEISKLRPAYRHIDVDMPKFEIRTKLDFNSILPKVGVSKIFEERAPGIVENESLSVSKIFQEAFIAVDEEGATAGAFTGAVMAGLSSNSTPPPPLVFHMDHPFLYAILHEDKILFAGTYSG